MANFPTGTYIYSDAAIPSGWANQTYLGGRYVLGPDNSNQLGRTGGATTHTHAACSLSSVPGHNHGGSQSATSSFAGSWWGMGGSGGTAATSHDHAVNMTIDNSLAHAHTVSETGSANNDPSHTVLMLLRKS